VFTQSALTALLAQAGTGLPDEIATIAGSTPDDVASGSYLLLFVYLSLAIGVSFLCSLVEAGILSIRKPQILVLVGEGRRSGRFLSGAERR